MSLMRQETLSIPAVVQHMLDQDSAINSLADQLAADLPELIISVARGSSDHAAAFFGYAMMSQFCRSRYRWSACNNHRCA